MKKQTKLQILKGLVNDSVLERVKLCRYGVQAYNIVKGEEYAVIAAFAKQGGRYYFIDREGCRFLASHYDRAEWLAGEVLEVLADDKAAVSETVDQLERSGSVLVCADFLALFFEECDRRNLTVKSTAAGVDELERMLTRYDLVKQSDESNNDTQSDDSEDEQTAAEPSALAQKVTKVIFLFEHYIIKVDGTWCLMKNYIYNEYDKQKQLGELKRQGYKYNRKQKAYILESDPVESIYNYSVVIKKYYV